MALDDKNILITPNTGTANEPKIEFTGADASGNDTITLSASYDGSVSTLSFEASTGQLFSVANIDSDGDGYSFSINDNSGIPAVLVELDGTIQLNPNTGNVLIGTSTDDGQNVLQVSGNTKLTGDVSGITDLYIDDQIISTGDTNTYLQFHAADQFRIVTGGTERLEVKNTNPVVLVTGNLRVEGNIEATGTLDTTGQNDLSVSDKRITLNDGEPLAGVNGGTGGELAVSGIFIDRGTLDSASFVFNETKDAWQARINTAFNTPTLANFEADSIGATIVGYGSTTTLKGNLDWSYIQSKPDPVVTVTLTGDVTGSGNTTLTDLGNGTISFATTVAANSVALGTDTTGNYVATIAAGTPGAETSSSGLTISAAAGEGTAATIAHADTSTQASVDNSGNTFIQDITLDTYGHITGITSATTSIGNATITIAGGTDLQNTAGDFTTNQTANETITINHSNITRTDTTSTATPAYGGTFTVIDTLTTNARGHVTAANVKTVTIPASDNTNTTYDLSIIQTGGTDDNPAIRLAAGGSGSGNDDLTLTGGGAITITRTSATGLTIAHTDTSSVGNLSSDNANGVVLQDISFTFDTYGHTTAASVATTDLDTRYIRSFQVEDGDGTEVTINQANEWKFVEGAGDGASIDINWTDVSNGTDADPYDLTFSVTNTDKGSAQNIFKTFTVDDTDTEYTWADTGSAVADNNADTLTFVSGNDFDVDVDATNDAIRFQHVDITRTDTTSTASPGYSGTFTVIDSLTTNARGHVTAANVKTVTIPASDNTNTTYSISTEPGDDGVSEKIRLTAGGSGSGTDDIVLAVAQTGTTDGLDISETGDTITFAHHDTSTLSGAQGSAGIASITVDEMGHVTAVTTATYNNYSHPTYTARSIDTSGVDVLDIFTSDTLGHVTNITKRTLPNATASVVGVVSTGAQEFGGVKTFKGGSIVLDNAIAPSLVFNYVPADNAITATELLGTIQFKGTDESITDVSVEIRANAYNEWNTGSTTTDAPGELSVWVVRDGTETLYETLTINQAEVVVNEGSQDVDFRVESNSYSHNLHVDGNTQKFQVGRMNSILADGNSLLANIVGDVTKKPGLRLYNLQNDTSWDDGDILGQVDFFTEDGDNITGMIQSINGRTGTNQAQPIGDMIFKTQATAGANAINSLQLSNQDSTAIFHTPFIKILPKKSGTGLSENDEFGNVLFKNELLDLKIPWFQIYSGGNPVAGNSDIYRNVLSFDSSFDSEGTYYAEAGSSLYRFGATAVYTTPNVGGSYNISVPPSRFRIHQTPLNNTSSLIGAPLHGDAFSTIDFSSSESTNPAIGASIEAVVNEPDIGRWDITSPTGDKWAGHFVGTNLVFKTAGGSRQRVDAPGGNDNDKVQGDARLLPRLTINNNRSVRIHGTLIGGGTDGIENNLDKRPWVNNGLGWEFNYDNDSLGVRALTEGLVFARLSKTQEFFPTSPSKTFESVLYTGAIGANGRTGWINDSSSYIYKPAWDGLLPGNDPRAYSNAAGAQFAIDSASDSAVTFKMQVFKGGSANEGLLKALFGFTGAKYDGDTWRLGNISGRDGSMYNGGIMWSGSSGSMGRPGSGMFFNMQKDLDQTSGGAGVPAPLLSPNYNTNGGAGTASQTNSIRDWVSGANAWTHIVGRGGIAFNTGNSNTDPKRLSTTMVITDSAVGIGTNAPLTSFHVQSTDDLFATVKSTKTDGQAQISFVNDARQYNVGVNNLDKFDIYDLTAAASRLTIDTSGNLVVGNSITNPASGFSDQRGFGYTNSTGKVEIATTANGPAIEIGKNNANNGSLVVFRKQSSVVGSIGTTGSNLTIDPEQKLDILGRNIVLDDYTAVGRVPSSAASVFGHNAEAGTSNNQIVSGNSSWHSHFMRMYYDEGIAFHVSNANTGTAGDVLHDQDTPSNEVSYCNEAMRIDIGGKVGIGTTYATSRLHLKTAASISNTVNDVLTIETYRSDVTGFNGGAIVFRNGDTNSAGQARIKVGSANDTSIGLNNEPAQSFIFETGYSQSTEATSITGGQGSYITIVHDAWPQAGIKENDLIAIDDGSYLGSYTVTTVTSSTQFTALDRLGRDFTATSQDTAGRTMHTAYPIDAMLIRADGDVGIGTITPVERLHVYDPTQVVGGKQLVLQGGDGGYGAGISFQTVIGGSGGTRNEMAKITADGNNSFNTTAATQDAELRFYTTNDGAIGQRMVIDNFGRVGINTTSVSTGRLLDIYNANNGDCQAIIYGAGLTNTNSSYWRAQGRDTSTLNIRGGELGVYKHSGITSSCAYIKLDPQDGNTGYYWTDDNDQLEFSNNAANIGKTTGSIVGLQTSDERLKNIDSADFSYGIETVKQLKPIRFAFKKDPDKFKLGFGAQTTLPIVPEAVLDTYECIDGYEQVETLDSDGKPSGFISVPKSDNPETKLNMEYVTLIPVLTKAIQEQQSMIEALTARIEELENR